MPDEILLNEAAYAVWQTVKERGPIELGEVVKLRGIDQAQVSAAATEAAQQGYFKIDEYEGDPLASSSDRQQARELAAFRKVSDSMRSILRHDEGDVSMERQVNEIVKNQQQHNLAIGIMSAQFRLLRAAITERVA